MKDNSSLALLAEALLAGMISANKILVFYRDDIIWC